VRLQTDLDESYEIPELARKLQLTGTLSYVEVKEIYSFQHNRLNGPLSTPPTVSVGTFSSASGETPLYYVVAAVYYDQTQNLEYESSFSMEVIGHPLQVTTALGAFQTVTRNDIVKSFISSVYRSNPQLKVEAGSVLRDTVIDPFSSEAERIRFVLDFFQRARTPTLLLQIDDPNGTGSSIPVANSPYKQGLKAAFYLTSDAITQQMVDSAFDAYATNFGVRRKAGVSAQGEVTFYTTTRPQASIIIPLGTIVGSGSAQFATTRASQISLSQIASYYNPVTGRYSVTVPVRAVSTGPAGNIGAGQVRVLASKISGLSVTNGAPMFGGASSESNLQLTVRTLNRLASVDTGTERGYLQTAADVPGVVTAQVVGAGSPYMQRDLYNGTHLGGKVDIWVQGENFATVTDTFAFTYQISTDTQFVLLGSPSDLIFQAQDSSLSTSNPIVEMLDYPQAGFQFKNVTTGETFDLTGVQILTYNTIQLSSSVIQPAVTLTDVVLGSFRKRASVDFVLPRQPVSAVTSVVGAVSGTLPSSAYTLYHPSSPLQYGRSSQAGDYLNVQGYVDDNGNLVPSGETISASENHVLIGTYSEYLDNLGALYYTIKVYNADKTLLYKGPNDPSGDPDYAVNLGTQTVAASIQRLTSGNITSGETVVIEYDYDENFVVTYTTNLIVSTTQNEVDAKKHATADVLVKDGINTPVNIEATVLVQKGRDQTTVDSSLRTNLQNFFTNLRLGDSVRQSDIIGVIEGTEGVSYVVVPLYLLSREVGYPIPNEAVNTDVAADSTLVSSLSTNSVAVYLLNNGLTTATVDGGGVGGEYRGVFQDEVGMNLLDGTATLSSLGIEAGRAYIVGNGGAVIQGISDDATLIAEGYVTESLRVARRKELTSNHVLISLPVGSSPVAHQYAAFYNVGLSTGTQDLDASPLEYFSAGVFTFTYDEAR
jgi:hypothetical protein